MKISMTASELALAAKLQAEINTVQYSLRIMDDLEAHTKLVGKIEVTTSCGTTSMDLRDIEPAQAFELLYGMRQARLANLVAQLDQLGITLED